MQENHELPSLQQLELDFELTNIALTDELKNQDSNVIKVTFGKAKNSPSAAEKEEQEFIDRIVESARRLSW